MTAECDADEEDAMDGRCMPFYRSIGVVAVLQYVHIALKAIA